MEALIFVLFLILCFGVGFCLVFLEENNKDEIKSKKKEINLEDEPSLIKEEVINVVKDKSIWKQTAIGIVFSMALLGYWFRKIFFSSQNSGINLLMIWIFIILLSVELSYALSIALNTKAKKGEIILAFWRGHRVMSYRGYLRLILCCFIFTAVDGFIALLLAPCKYQPWLPDLQNMFFILFIVLLGLSVVFLFVFGIQMLFIIIDKKIKEMFNKKD